VERTARHQPSSKTSHSSLVSGHKGNPGVSAIVKLLAESYQQVRFLMIRAELLTFGAKQLVGVADTERPTGQQ
jgi:hypothetical protein